MKVKDISSNGVRQRDKLSLVMPIVLEEPQEDKPPHISGFGIHPGLFNQVVEVQEDELDNFERTLNGAQLRADHGDGVLDVIGRVNETLKTFDSKAGKEGVKYYAEVDEDDEKALRVYNKVKKGYVEASSVGFYHDSICSKCGEDFHTCNHWFDEAHVIAKNCESFEISIVSLGADSDATASVSGLNKQFVNKFKKQFDDKKSRLKSNNTGGKVMEPKDDVKQPLDVGKIVQQLAESQADSIQKGKSLEKLQADLAKTQKALDKLQKEQENKTDAEQETIAQLKASNEKLQKSLDEITGEATKKAVSELVERQVAVGLVKEDEKEAKIESLLGTNKETIDILTKDVEVLEAKKEEKPEKKEGKIPEVHNFDKNKKEISEAELRQIMVHTIFRYDRVFTPEKSMENTYVGF